jgi:NAD(P)-dependent dehydrogenase (short-subunit alcohol dehydrogenase family)
MTPRVQGLLKERQSDELRQKILNEIPVRRHAEVDDVAQAVAYLASCEAGFITGTLLDINGGQAMST